MLLSIAVVEDDEGYRARITGFIDRFEAERGLEIKVKSQWGMVIAILL